MKLGPNEYKLHYQVRICRAIGFIQWIQGGRSKDCHGIDWYIREVEAKMELFMEDRYAGVLSSRIT